MNRILVFLSRLFAPREGLEHSAIVEARDAFGYWSERADALPWHRRAERRQAREMTATWRARLIGAHLERWRLGRFQPAVMPVLDTGGRSAATHARRLAWSSARRTAIGRRILMAALAAAVVAAAALTALVALAVHLGAI
jgi:hypothetical protein